MFPKQANKSQSIKSTIVALFSLNPFFLVWRYFWFGPSNYYIWLWSLEYGCRYFLLHFIIVFVIFHILNVKTWLICFILIFWTISRWFQPVGINRTSRNQRESVIEREKEEIRQHTCSYLRYQLTRFWMWVWLFPKTNREPFKGMVQNIGIKQKMMIFMDQKRSFF